MTSYSKTV